MKYDLKISFLLVSLFLASQIVGIFFISGSILNISFTPEGVEVERAVIPVERPDINPLETFLLIGFSVILGAGLLLIIMKFKVIVLWKALYFFALLTTMHVAFSIYLPFLVAGILALVLAILKLFRKSAFIHNLTELFIYAGLSIVFVPILNVFWMIMLLIAVSIYDVIAVYKTRHMVDIAVFLGKSKAFTGLSIPLDIEKADISKEGKESIRKRPVQEAMLGGGDIAFPMIFTGVVFESLLLGGFERYLSLGLSMVITAFATLTIFLILYWGKKNQFYPAMPFLTAGCLGGYGVILLVLGFL